MNVFILSVTVFMNNGTSRVIGGAWKAKPTKEEAEEYVRVTWPGFIKNRETGELYSNEIFVHEYKLRSNIGFHTRQNIKANKIRFGGKKY